VALFEALETSSIAFREPFTTMVLFRTLVDHHPVAASLNEAIMATSKSMTPDQMVARVGENIKALRLQRNI
jgi:hypothetical protein